ncbi:HolB ATPase involved in DNA replication [uncultured Caudovirales phage]|uniref:Sliding-clamp-loader large subunit n=1 Tax=uncultured Caudovirales phage TaxID=2100421 RepID=A0A6J5LTH1_9CAUD|nr:HolB ATPase involved in DNA replication [uncultured Caudovirales phage]
MKQLWTEKYRPQDLDGYVFRDQAQKDQVAGWIKSESIPHLLFSGAPGVGKTTLAKILINQLGIDEYDVLEINASRENSVDTIRDKITGFVQTMPFGNFKVVLLDEADYISPNGQAALRGVMETYHASARFILTCNYPNRIIPALHSRCQGFHIERVDVTEFTARMATVLVTENIEFDLDTLDSYVKATYPDLRKCLNMCQMNSQEGKLSAPNGDEGGAQDWKLDAVNLFKAGRVTEARKLMCASVRPEEMEDMFRWMYDNLELWSKDPERQDQAIVIIRNGLINVPMVADQEINLSATLIELTGLK